MCVDAEYFSAQRIIELLNHHQLHVEDEGGAAGDGALAPGSIPQVTGDGQLGPLTKRHLRDALLPALNNLLLA